MKKSILFLLSCTIMFSTHGMKRKNTFEGPSSNKLMKKIEKVVEQKEKTIVKEQINPFAFLCAKGFEFSQAKIITGLKDLENKQLQAERIIEDIVSTLLGLEIINEQVFYQSKGINLGQKVPVRLQYHFGSSGGIYSIDVELTPFMAALNKRSKCLVEAFLAYADQTGQNITSQSVNGFTPLEVAECSRDKELIKLLKFFGKNYFDQKKDFTKLIDTKKLRSSYCDIFFE